MRLIVQDDDVLFARQIAANTPDHLIGRLFERVLFTASENGLGETRCIALLAWKKSVVIRDRNPRLSETGEQIRRQEVALSIVIFGVAREQHAQAIADRDPRSHDEEGIGEPGILPILEFIERLPG